MFQKTWFLSSRESVCICVHLWLRKLGPIERLVAFDGDAIAQPLLREVVPHRVMHGRAIVPEGERVGPPGEAALELRRLAVTIEHLQQRIAFMTAEPHDAGGEV